MTAYFFGPRGRPGHYWWGETGREELDGPKGLPWTAFDGRLTPKNVKRQGLAALHHLDGWTALAFHDYTSDGRPGSNCAFVFDETLDFDEVMVRARELWPKDLARIGEVVLA